MADPSGSAMAETYVGRLPTEMTDEYQDLFRVENKPARCAYFVGVVLPRKTLTLFTNVGEMKGPGPFTVLFVAHRRLDLELYTPTFSRAGEGLMNLIGKGKQLNFLKGLIQKPVSFYMPMKIVHPSGVIEELYHDMRVDEIEIKAVGDFTPAFMSISLTNLDPLNPNIFCFHVYFPKGAF